MNTSDQSAFAAERARELLELSSDSVGNELARAQGWLREAQYGGTASYWHVEGVAGALGALANAWGRLTLWSRAAGLEDAVGGDLESCMNELVDLRGRLARSEPMDEDIRCLTGLLDRMRHIHHALEESDSV